MSNDSFTHLHVHTEFSMLDGAARLDEMVAKAVGDGQPAIGITDHGNMYGTLEFYKECKKQGIKPIIGTEAYMAHDHRSERPTRRGRVDDSGGETDGGKKLYYHLTLLAENEVGYRNLIQLSSLAFLEGYYYKPRMDWELLEKYSDGLIATTGCLGGHVLQSLLNGDEKGALDKAGRLQEIFGKDNLFVELQDHGIPEQHTTNPQLMEIAQKIGAPLLATNDLHYTHREDHESHDALLCVQTGALISDPKRFKFHGEEHYLKSAQEMRYLFREVPEACDNTLWIAERADLDITFGDALLPNFPLPEGFADDSAYLDHLTWEGAKKRWGDDLPPSVVERVAYELKVINDMGFASYFLITWDLINYAREAGIRVGPGRGSAAGCAVAYCLWITDLDPIKYDLLFERFLNPSRVSMPDIDMDFDSRYRDQMIRYAADRYGRDHVAQIITFGTIKARNAVRDAARVLGYPYGVGDKIAKAMPPLVMGRDTPLKYCFEQTEKYADGFKAASDLRAMYDTQPDVKRVVDVAKGLEGLKRSDGIHAAAVVITKEPVTHYLPIQRKPESGQDPEDAPVVTQYEMHGVEELGLLKMDFLGLRNLDVITDAQAMIRANRDPNFDIDTVSLEDQKTFDLLARGDTIGVFQLESPPMRQLLKAMAPTTFEDVSAVLALYRPGPMSVNMHYDFADRKNGRKPVEYFHDDAKEVLDDTYGLMIYQESVMRVAQKFAGYSLAEADNLRKACLPAGTRLLTRSRGYVPIEKIMSLRDRRVQTIDTDTSATRHEVVDDVWSVGVKDVWRLTTATGYTIEATDDHKFLLEGEWVGLGSLAPGDLVGVAGRTVTHGGAKVDPAEVDLAALLISEGYLPDPDGPPRTAHFTNTDPELLDAFRAAYERRFGEAHHRESTSATGVTQLRLTRAELRDLRPVVGAYGTSEAKVVPERFVNAPAVAVERFLGLYFCADGWADESGVHYASKSRAVVGSLKRMLLRFGIVGTIRSRDIDGHGRHYTLSVRDKGHAKAFARVVEPHLTTVKYDKVRHWLHEWGNTAGASATLIGIPTSFVRSELDRRVEATGRSKRALGVDGGGLLSTRLVHRNTLDGLLYSERLEDLRSGDLLWDTVESIEYAGQKECFDFQMANGDRPYAVAEDFLVHNCGKKIREMMAKERDAFEDGVERTGYGRELGKSLFDIIEKFADYAFNKSHTFGYGLVTYQTAYLKAHYPVEYFACLLTSVKSNLDKAAVYLADCRSAGIKVLTPDINRSVINFDAIAADKVPDDVALPMGSPGAITFGLSAVRNVGEALVEQLLTERQENGEFTDFYDFAERVPEPVLNKRTVESLIKAGAFDRLNHPRRGLLAGYEPILDTTIDRRRERDRGVMSLFGDWNDDAPADEGGGFDERLPIPDIEFDKSDKLRNEKEMLGLYVSDHPLFGVESALKRRVEHSISDLETMDDGAQVVVGGVITGLARKFTKKGDQMAVFVLEDLESSIEVTVFPRTLLEQGHKLQDDVIVSVKGRLDKRDESRFGLIAQFVEVLSGLGDGPAAPLRLRLPSHALDELKIQRLKRILRDHPGDSVVQIDIGQGQVVRLADEFRVDIDRAIGELRMAFGHDAVEL
ncbi:DNA polymerase-3 subunit alpha [Ilumatobacter fluminis]|uniref:DNA polymerase III subunit alpha n=1 Tax=Ilumatobacter fluminis TaxID=467091 RepID=A0A4R7HYS0_9ACTN|nr:DNA polymerase III subunit alpha [Ilumatobacter fluminis]TDT16235.1 DNA polymerase-3 subunit alpha [Ilumatobacter fluminis]